MEQGGGDGTPSVLLLASSESVGEDATFDHGAVCPNGGKVALAYTCGALHIYNSAEFRRISPNPIYRNKRVRHLAWQMFQGSYTVGAADAEELTLYDGWQSMGSEAPFMRTIRSSERIDAWTWMKKHERIAILAGNKVSIHDQVLSGKEERASGVAGGSSLLGAAAEKWKQIVPLPGGDEAAAFVAVLTEPCLQAQIRSRNEEGHELNETLETLRSVQRKRKEKRNMKYKKGEGGDIVMDEGKETAAEQAGSSSSSDAVVDLRGKMGGGGSGGIAASTSLLDTLIGGITRASAAASLLPKPPTTQSDDDGGPKLLFLRVAVVPSTGRHGEQMVLRSIPLDTKMLAMPALLASSQNYVAIGDPWSSTLVVHRLSDEFPAVTTTEERQFQLPDGLLPRGLRVYGDRTLVCLAVEAAGAKGGGRGGEGGGGAGGGTAQGSTTATFIDFSLKEGEVREEPEVAGSGSGASADPNQEQQQRQQQLQQQQGSADIMAFLRSFRDEMRERFDKLEGRMEMLERRLSEL